MAACIEEGASEMSEEEEYRKKCSHYSRGCSFVSPCCGKVYPCRLCHDDKEPSHEIDRHAVSQVVCRKCSKRQPVGEKCIKCGILFGRYFCAVCRLYDDADKGQFHCDKCGLCRVGGQDNFFHCDNCGLCLSLAMRDGHTCRRQMSKDNCPVCMEDIHTSRAAAHVPNCGHLLHMPCYQEMIRKGLYQCPQCQTSLADMSSHWRHMDTEREAWQLPQHLQEFKVKVRCRDCHKESNTNFHVVGFKCAECDSYNTVRCGTEELPEDPNPGPGGVAGIIRRVVVAAGGGGNQEGEEDESDSSSNDESGGHSDNDSDHDGGNDSDHDGGNEGPGNSAHRGNQQPDAMDRDHHHDNAANDDQSEDAPGNHRLHDDGDVDEASYDGDESDYDEDYNSETSEEFFDCSNHIEQKKFPLIPRQRQRQSISRPIRLQTRQCPQWWESEGEEEIVRETSLIRTCPTSHVCSSPGHKRSRKPHPPIQVMVEQLNVMDIWGSDYFTDSFSEMSSESSCEEDTGFEGMKFPRQQPLKPLKKRPSINNIPSHNVQTDKTLQGPPTRMYCKSPSVTVVVQNGLNTRCSCDASDGRDSNTVASPRETALLHVKNSSNAVSLTWVRKSSSEESWVTANEDLELGTLV